MLPTNQGFDPWVAYRVSLLRWLERDLGLSPKGVLAVMRFDLVSPNVLYTWTPGTHKQRIDNFIGDWNGDPGK